MPKKYFHKRKLDIPLYRRQLIIIITNSRKKIKKLCKKYKKNHAAITWIDKKADVYIALNFNGGLTHGILNHEINHATNFILADRGVLADFSNDEPIAYLLNWVADEVYKFTRDKKIKIEYAD